MKQVRSHPLFVFVLAPIRPDSAHDAGLPVHAYRGKTLGGNAKIAKVMLAVHVVQDWPGPKIWEPARKANNDVPVLPITRHHGLAPKQ